MQISQRQGGGQSRMKKANLLKREYFNHIRKIICGRNLKVIGQPRPVGPVQLLVASYTVKSNTVNMKCS